MLDASPGRSDAVGDDQNLLLDELSERMESLRLLRMEDPDAACAVLEGFGTQGRVEEDILKQLSTVAPIAYPDRFGEAHRRAMRAFEVYDRNGPRPASVPTSVPKPLRMPVARVVRVLIRMIVRKHQRALAVEVRQLYALREASAVPGSPEHLMLTRARKQVDAIRSDLSKNPLPLPAFIGVGAAVSATLSWVQKGLADELGRLLVLGAFAVIGLAGFWCVVHAAGVARRRTRLSLDAPMQALWEVMGDAGALPTDKSRTFAVVATGVLIAVWVIVPVMVGLVVRNL